MATIQPQPTTESHTDSSWNTAATRRHVRGAAHLVRALAAVKWTLIVVNLLAGLLTATAISDSKASDSGWLIGPVLVGACIAAVVTWALLGWFQHVLRLLADIADRG